MYKHIDKQIKQIYELFFKQQKWELIKIRPRCQQCWNVHANT